MVLALGQGILIFAGKFVTLTSNSVTASGTESTYLPCSLWTGPAVSQLHRPGLFAFTDMLARPCSEDK